MVANRLGTGEVLGSNPGKGETFSEKKVTELFEFEYKYIITKVVRKDVSSLEGNQKKICSSFFDLHHPALCKPSLNTPQQLELCAVMIMFVEFLLTLCINFL